MSLILESCSEGLCLLLVAWLAQKSEHVLLVSLYARLVERIHTEDITADTACLLEEIEEGSEVVLVHALDRERNLRNTTVDMCELYAQLSHLVDLVEALACEEVQSVEILLVGGHYEAVVGILYRNHGLEDGALALLNPLTH